MLLQAIPLHPFPKGWGDLRVFRATVLVCPHWDLQSDSSFSFFVFVLLLVSQVVYTMVFRECVVNTKMQFIIHRKDWLMFEAPSQGLGDTDSTPLNWIPDLLQEYTQKYQGNCWVFLPPYVSSTTNVSDWWCSCGTAGPVIPRVAGWLCMCYIGIMLCGASGDHIPWAEADFWTHWKMWQPGKGQKAFGTDCYVVLDTLMWFLLSSSGRTLYCPSKLAKCSNKTAKTVFVLNKTNSKTLISLTGSFCKNVAISKN